jgi:hypothetical protein
MSSAVRPFPNDCYHLFVEPFKQGAWNVRDAIDGNRTRILAVDALGAPTVQRTPLPLAERVGALCVGILLLVPVVNAIAMLILNRAGSPCLYVPPALPVSSAGSSGGGAASSSALPPSSSSVPVDPLPGPATLIPRKTAALARLAAIEAMGPAATRHFVLNPTVMTFDLGAVLQRYPAVEPPMSLRNLVDWAGVGRNQRGLFEAVLNRYNNGGDPQATMVRTLLSHVKGYFTQRRREVAAGSQEEMDLKEQFRVVVERTVNANQNCVDQMLSQMEGIMLDVVADGVPGSAAERSLTRLLYRVGHELCKYRSQLLKEICARQNPRENHMPTLERVVKQRLSAALGMEGAIFDAGARYASMLRDYECHAARAGREQRIEQDIQRAVDTFIVEYHPEEYLANDLRGNIGIARRLRGDLSVWADHYFGISREDADAADSTAATVPATLNMDQRLAENPADPYGAFTMGGNWSSAATLCLLEAANIVQRVNPPGP